MRRTFFAASLTQNVYYHLNLLCSGDPIGFRLSPEPCKRPSTDPANDYDLFDRPGPELSRAELLPYLLDNLEHVDDVCSEPDCPYNLWLYADQEYPAQLQLSDWEKKKLQTKIQIPRVALPAPKCLSGLDPSPPATSSSESCSSPTNRSSALPPYSETIISASQSASVSVNLEEPYYPIITLPRSKRDKSNGNSYLRRSGLCCLPLEVQDKDPYAIKLGSLMTEPRPESSCSCSTRSSCSCCSSGIPEPEDPTAPHAFTVQDGAAAKKKKRGKGCNTACCASLTFIVFCILGLACLLLFLYFNTNAMNEGMTTS